MSTKFYIMNYVGSGGVGGGAICMGNGKIVGADIGNGRYHGTYVEQGGRIKAECILSMPNGGQLVTGAQLPAGSSLRVLADWPANFADGTPQALMVEGGTVHVTLEKIGEI